MNWLKRFLQDFPTTNGRIVLTLVVVTGTAVRYLGWGVPQKQGIVADGWTEWLVFLAALAGIDVGQYLGKRFSDTNYATAKNLSSPPSVNVEQARTVTAEQAVVQSPMQAPAQLVNAEIDIARVPPTPTVAPRSDAEMVRSLGAVARDD